MVQEVQTGVGITNETTLETIEAIGTSSFKIIEGRQTRGMHYSIGCSATGTASFNLDEDDRDTGEVKCQDFAITDQYGKQEFVMIDHGIRIPTAGTYEMNITWRGGAMYLSATVILKCNGETIYTQTSSGTPTSHDDTIHLNLGKFDMIELYTRHYYSGSGSAGGAGFQEYPVITIKQL